jgi:hypothetical protein
MVPSQSRSRCAAPLLILLLSTSVQAQYTLRGRVTHDHDLVSDSLVRREEPAPSSAPLRGQEGEAKGGDGEGDDPKPDEGEAKPQVCFSFNRHEIVN